MMSPNSQQPPTSHVSPVSMSLLGSVSTVFTLLLIILVQCSSSAPHQMIQPPSANCSACAERELFKQIIKTSIKEEILRKLGFSQAPNVTRNGLQLTNHFLRQLINKMEGEASAEMMSDEGYLSTDDYHFQTSQISIMATQPPPSVAQLHRHSKGLYLYFKLNHGMIGSHQDLASSLSASLLWLHLPASPSPNDTDAKIRIYYVVNDKKSKSGQTKILKAKEAKVQLRQDRGGSVYISLLHLTKHWMRNPEENLGIVIRAKTNNNNEIRVDNSLVSQMTPYIQLYIRDSRWRSRVRRTTDRTVI